MKKFIWLVSALFVMGSSSALAEDSMAKADTTVDIQAQGQESGTIADYLAANTSTPGESGACYDHDMTGGQFTCLSALLKQTGLDKTLSEAGSFTVFAPTDEAFKTLAGTMTPEDFNALLANNKELTKILTYHVLPEQQTLSDLFAGAADNQVSKASVEKTDVTLTFTGADEDQTNTTITFAGSDAKVLDGQTVVDNGVIIPIDHVLMPPAGM